MELVRTRLPDTKAVVGQGTPQEAPGMAWEDDGWNTRSLHIFFRAKTLKGNQERSDER